MGRVQRYGSGARDELGPQCSSLRSDLLAKGLGSDREVISVETGVALWGSRCMLSGSCASGDRWGKDPPTLMLQRFIEALTRLTKGWPEQKMREKPG